MKFSFQNSKNLCIIYGAAHLNTFQGMKIRAYLFVDLIQPIMKVMQTGVLLGMTFGPMRTQILDQQRISEQYSEASIPLACACLVISFVLGISSFLLITEDFDEISKRLVNTELKYKNRLTTSKHLYSNERVIEIKFLNIMIRSVTIMRTLIGYKFSQYRNAKTYGKGIITEFPG